MAEAIAALRAGTGVARSISARLIPLGLVRGRLIRPAAVAPALPSVFLPRPRCPGLAYADIRTDQQNSHGQPGHGRTKPDERVLSRGEGLHPLDDTAPAAAGQVRLLGGQHQRVGCDRPAAVSRRLFRYDFSEHQYRACKGPFRIAASTRRLGETARARSASPSADC